MSDLIIPTDREPTEAECRAWMAAHHHEYTLRWELVEAFCYTFGVAHWFEIADDSFVWRIASEFKAR